ncbi:MAG: hypothetical protein LIO51_08015 [Clostridiales bacterium]|nr:hypothetical protein [Clostridiales bacterium]
MANAARQYYSYETAVPRRKRDNGPQLQELPLVRPRKKGQTQEQVQSRIKVNLRTKESVSILPVLGFAAAAVMAVMILFSYTQLNAIYAETVIVRDELSELQEEGEKLEARYEEVFDQAALQEAVDNADVELSEAGSDQKIYVDLSEPDSAVVYGESTSLLEQIQALWDSLWS